jgi:hypothetical protein
MLIYLAILAIGQVRGGMGEEVKWLGPSSGGALHNGVASEIYDYFYASRDLKIEQGYEKRRAFVVVDEAFASLPADLQAKWLCGWFAAGWLRPPTPNRNNMATVYILADARKKLGTYRFGDRTIKYAPGMKPKKVKPKPMARGTRRPR